ncbi:hypothetical protein E4K73_06635 [Streptomyces sp. IB201691-2A2]|nr:hypothetical protein E4K73_06635 [Streptomyces sp. IB201691-2A2]
MITIVTPVRFARVEWGGGCSWVGAGCVWLVAQFPAPLKTRLPFDVGSGPRRGIRSQLCHPLFIGRPREVVLRSETPTRPLAPGSDCRRVGPRPVRGAGNCAPSPHRADSRRTATPPLAQGRGELRSPLGARGTARSAHDDAYVTTKPSPHPPGGAGNCAIF